MLLCLLAALGLSTAPAAADFAAPQVVVPAGGDQTTPPTTVSIALADLRGIGRDDLIELNNAAQLVVRLSQADGTLGPPAVYGVAVPPGANNMRPSQVLVGDFTGDGRPDVVALGPTDDQGSHWNSAIVLWPGGGNGTFGPPVRTDLLNASGAPFTGWQLASGPIFANGGLGLVVTGRDSSTGQYVLTYQPSVTGKFAAAGSYRLGNITCSLDCIGVAVAPLSPGAPASVITSAGAFGNSTLDVFSSDGTGALRAPLQATSFADPGSNDPNQLVVGDFNGDGRIDLAMTNPSNDDGSGAHNNTLGLWPAIGDGTLGSLVYPLGCDRPGDLAVADLNGDGHLDLVTSSFAARAIGFALGNGDGTFTAPAYAPMMASGNPPSDIGQIAAGPLSPDGLPDVAVVDASDDTEVFRNAFARPMKIVVHLSTPVTAGAPITVTATAEDLAGRRLDSYAGAATWSDLSGTLSPSAPTNFVNGVATTTGASIAVPWRRDAISIASGGVTGTSPAFNVLGPVAGFVVRPTGPVTAGQAFLTKVYAVDGLGDPVTTYAGAAPSVSDLSGQLSGSLAAFSGGTTSGSLTIAVAYRRDTLSVSNADANGTSPAFNVAPP